MKAPKSDRIRRILAHPATARQFMEQLITSRQHTDNPMIQVELDGQKYTFGRVARRSVSGRQSS
jgi:hypothetical protein